MVTRAMAFPDFSQEPSKPPSVAPGSPEAGQEPVSGTRTASALSTLRSEVSCSVGEERQDLTSITGGRERDPLIQWERSTSIVLATVASGPSPRPLRRPGQDVNWSVFC